jgi:L-alanine-DL-glutamate epimerase-like enolase superfamily enzyme
MNDINDFAVSARDRNAVKITAIECIPLNVPFKVPFKISTGAARPVVETLIVKVHTDQGITGIGETQAWRRQGSAETLAGQINIIKNHFEPQVVGRSPFDIASIMHGLNESMYHSHYSQAPIGDALYDIVGKVLGVPIHQILGGKTRDSVRLAAVLTMKGTIESLVESADEFFEQGFRHFVLKIGNDPMSDLKNVEALRNRFGHEVALRVDANAALDYDAALSLLTKLEPFDLETVEQPLAIWDIDGMAALAKAIRMPLMADECAATDHALIEIIRKRAATSAQTKVAKNGGIYHIRRLWHILAAAGMGINPGNHPATSVATASVAHMCGSWSTELMAGVFAVGVSGALAEDIVENPLRPVDGELPIPDGPGLGVILDEDALKSLRIDI